MTNRYELLTRVEGAGEVQLQIDAGRLVAVRVAMLDIPRGFDRLVRGRHFSEVPRLVSRVCAICSAAHRVAAARALEQALGVSVPPAASALRELLLLGALIESHALHLFLLVYPDMHRCDSVAELLAIAPEQVKAGLELRQLGCLIQEVAGGRAIHPPNVEVGGVVAWPDQNELEEVFKQLCHWQGRWPALQGLFTDGNAYPSSHPVEALDLMVANGQLWHDGAKWPLADYAGILQGVDVDYSHARQYRHNGSPLLAGALARARLMAGEADNGLGVFAQCAAQAREIGEAIDSSIAWFAGNYDARQLSVPVAPRAGFGVAALEAPRGTLLHAYHLAADGTVVDAEIITPTAINQLAMESHLSSDLMGEKADDGLSAWAAQIVRAFDPCISCAVHQIRS
jgi:sulfhydrogenase subunit alpha